MLQKPIGNLNLNFNSQEVPALIFASSADEDSAAKHRGTISNICQQNLANKWPDLHKYLLLYRLIIAKSVRNTYDKASEID